MKSRALWVSLLLFGSGLTALVYQVAWTRELRLIFGFSTAASAAVVAIFMGGLGIGGLLLGPRADRNPRPLAFYGRLELLVAGSAAVTPALVWLVRVAYIAAGGTIRLGMAGGTVVRLLLSVIVLAVPTVLMGGTLPAATRAVETEDDQGRRFLALLYGSNTLGAVAGTVLSNFFLLETLGTRLTLWSSCLVNAFVGLVAVNLSRRPAFSQAAAASETSPSPAADVSDEPERGARQSARSRKEKKTRAREAPEKASTADAAQTSVAVRARRRGDDGLCLRAHGDCLVPNAGAASGRLDLHVRVDSRGRASRNRLGFTRAVESASTGNARRFRGHVRPRSGFARRALRVGRLGGDPRGSSAADRRLRIRRVRLQLDDHRVDGRVSRRLSRGIAVPDFDLVARARPGECRTARRIGVRLEHGGRDRRFARGRVRVAASFDGSRHLGLCGRPLDRACRGGAPAFVAPRSGARPVGGAGAAAVAVALMSSTGPTAAWRHSPIGAGRVDLSKSSPNRLIEWVRTRRRQLYWQADGVESSVGILKTTGGLAFAVSGKIDGNSRGDAATQVMGGLIGAALHPQPRRALVIGLGTGSTAGWLAAIPSMERVDVVELEPAILHVAETCTPVNHDVLSNPKVHVAIGDAREFLLTSRDKYDIIFSEPSNPYRAGISSLFTEEFYRAARQRLAPRGIFLQWLQTYEVDGETVRTVYAALHSSVSANRKLVCQASRLDPARNVRTGDL